MAQEGKHVDELSFEEACAAVGRALDAFCEAGECPLGELPEYPPLYMLHLGNRLIQEEQKVPLALKSLMSIIMEGVEHVAEPGNGQMPHRFVRELQGALQQGNRFLTDLTAFRVRLLDTEPLRGAALREMESRSPLLSAPLQEPPEEPSEATGERVRVEMPEEVREELEEAPEPRQPPEWVADGLADADARLAELERADRMLLEMNADPAADEDSVWNPGPGAVSPMPGRYIGLPPEPDALDLDVNLDPSASMDTSSPELQAMREKLQEVPDLFFPPVLTDMDDGPAVVTAGLERLASYPDVFVPQVYVTVGDTAAMEPVEPEHDPAKYVVLLDGVSSVAKAVVMAHAEPYPAEKLARGDVVPGPGGLFYVVESHKVEYSDGSRLVHVTYTDGDLREWFPGTMVTAYRPE